MQSKRIDFALSWIHLGERWKISALRERASEVNLDFSASRSTLPKQVALERVDVRGYFDQQLGVVSKLDCKVKRTVV